MKKSNNYISYINICFYKRIFWWSTWCLLLYSVDCNSRKYRLYIFHCFVLRLFSKYVKYSWCLFIVIVHRPDIQKATMTWLVIMAFSYSFNVVYPLHIKYRTTNIVSNWSNIDAILLCGIHIIITNVVVTTLSTNVLAYKGLIVRK